jgi:hypothetical protein
MRARFGIIFSGVYRSAVAVFSLEYFPSASLVIILDADDVVLAKITTRLYLD